MKISCPCGEEVQVPDVLLDHGVRCPHCGQPVELPVALDAREGSDDPVAEALPTAPDGEETGELAIAIDSPVVRSTARAKRPAAPQPDGNGDEPAAPVKRRDRWPIIITSAAFGLLIIILVVVIAASGDPPTEADESAENESHLPARPSVTAPDPTGTRGSYGGNADLFPNVPGNRTRKDYEEEQRRKRENGQ
jgi:hypothetical protein